MNRQPKAVPRAMLWLAAALLSLSAAAQDETVRLNKLIEMFQRGEPAFGLLSFDYSLSNARSLASSGLDFVLIDMEHAPFDVERLRAFLLGMTNKRAIMEKGTLQPDVVPFVRIPAAGGADELVAQAKQVLDVGAFGVMFPAIHNREQAQMRCAPRVIRRSTARRTSSRLVSEDAIPQTPSGTGACRTITPALMSGLWTGRASCWPSCLLNPRRASPTLRRSLRSPEWVGYLSARPI